MPSCLLDKFIRSSLTPVDCADVGAAVTTVICFLACKLSNLVLGPNSWTGPTSKTGPGRPLDRVNLKNWPGPPAGPGQPQTLARAARWTGPTSKPGPGRPLDWANLKLARAARWGLATHWTGPLLGLDRAT